MKFKNKCPICNRLATRRFRGRRFCEDCQRVVRRMRPAFVYRGELAYSFPRQIGECASGIYRDIPLPLR